ncbi:gibberellin 2-beta-dioxygenase-like [Cucumis sativus]|uniref:gibberellin 2beta-dioxygenase n=1 Tax=Cucumis sativus TaxID=3659 RepID=S0BE28_CUCSA|nr:gibberellin 2-beta-dioxygenase-like [Cucumis sativus]CCG14218.1 GA 2-oxidase [Cucumis sativus]
MVVLSQPPTLDFNQYSLLRSTCKPTASFADIPEIDLSDPNAKFHIVKACEEFGFFKLVNHGVPVELMTKLEDESLCFFKLSKSEKDKARTPHPLGYGSKNIGSNGDKGWIEYLLLNANPLPIFSHDFLCAATEYVTAVKKLSCEVVELIAEGLKMERRNAISKLLKDEKADCCFRVNHYPPCPEMQGLSGLNNMIGFGEHTDPQILSILRSNNSTGLQICLRDGAWVSVPADAAAFFVNVGDVLQVMTNGRFKSVKHKVVVDPNRERVSMIYFGGPPLSEKITPLPEVLKDGEESLYKEFTWWEYKTAAYKSKLADYRLGAFEKSPIC